MNRILITGGARFVGSHAPGFCTRKGVNVIVCDNLSRRLMLGKGAKTAMYNSNHLKRQPNIILITDRSKQSTAQNCLTPPR